MSDLINREDAINAIYHHFPDITMERATEILHECETAESVIRCEDCKYFHPGEYRYDDGTESFCEVHETVFHEDDFCSYGERRE